MNEASAQGHTDQWGRARKHWTELPKFKEGRITSLQTTLEQTGTDTKINESQN